MTLPRRELSPVERLGKLVQAEPDGVRKEMLLALLKEARDGDKATARLKALQLAGQILGLYKGEQALEADDPRVGSVLKGLKRGA